MRPHGIHHVTAITAHVRDNLAFYTGVLGMRLKPTALVLRDLLGMVEDRSYPAAEPGGESTHVFRMAADGPQSELHVVVEPHQLPGRPGAGGVHHVAFRIADEDYDAWTDYLRGIRLPASGPVDRYYFRSLYFYEPNGILFELATDGPGFTIDETVDELGRHLALPPALAHRRAEIEGSLEPLT